MTWPLMHRAYLVNHDACTLPIVNWLAWGHELHYWGCCQEATLACNHKWSAKKDQQVS